jgi:astacin
MPDNEIDECEYGSSDEAITCYISGVTFVNEVIECVVIDGEVIFEGDCLLGPLEEIEQANQMLGDLSPPWVAPWGLVVANPRFRWPRGIVTFTVDDDLPDKQRVTKAMRHWEKHTNIRFRRRTSEKNYVRFRAGNRCASSHVGMRGGEQLIRLARKCSVGNAIHEIGHCIGLFHEHSREDRNDFVRIIKENIKPDARGNFEQVVADGDDIYDYDYGSIMHYHAHAFAIDRSKPTIIPRRPGITIGQRRGLSQGDIRTVETIYPRRVRRH